MSDYPKKLTAWLTGELARAKPADKLVLRTAAPGSKGTEIETFEIETRLDAEELPGLADQILGRAQDDATGSGPSVQRYVLLSYRKSEEAKKPRARFMFRLRGESDLDLDDEAGEDAPTMKGLMTQLMRHNEASNRTMQSVVASFGTMMVRRLESSDRTINELIAERTQMFKEIEESRGDQHVRDMEALAETKKQERIDKGIDQLAPLIPVIVNRVTGTKMLPEGKTKTAAEALFKSLSPEQLQGIGQNLTAPQQIAFVELLKAFQETENKAKEN